MGCTGISNKGDDDKGGIARTYNLEVINKPLVENQIKLVEGVFVTNSKEDPFKYYDDLKIIGEGSFGKVHKVLSKSSKLIRAMKILDWEKIHKTTKTDSTDFINEIQFVKNLDHPNILKIFEIYEFNNKIHIVSELCTGGEVYELVTKKGRLKEFIVANIMRQLFSAINFYQSYGIVHSDIKPENLLIESKDDLNSGKITIKLIDFGLASKIGKQTLKIGENTKILGTMSYMSPESFDGQVSFKSDVWASGIVMYYLTEGKLPFRGNTNEDVIKAIKKCEYEYMSDISFEAKDLLSKLLVKNRDKRITAKQALEHSFITKYASMAKTRSSLSKARVSTILGNIQSFKIDKKLQEIVLGFLVYSISDSPEIKELRDLFTDFDINGDGRLTHDELKLCLQKILPKDKAEAEVKRIVSVLDSDQNGVIECMEFIRASVDPKILLTDENLIRVWGIFDKDRSGKISTEEIAAVISKDLKVDMKMCAEMIKEVDINGDGELSLSEFKKMMKSIFEN